MIEGSRRLSQRHITIRVPWHDAGWGGRVCKSPSANTSCLVLARIASGVRPDRDEFGGRAFDSLEITELPPCIEEHGGVTTGGEGVASRTMSTLHAILEHAVRLGKIERNPAKGVRRMASTARKRHLSRAEKGKLGEALRAAEAEGEHPKGIAAIRFLLLTGFRRMEGLGLQRAWQDDEEGSIRFPDTKSGAQTRVIGDAAIKVLLAQPQIGKSPYFLPADWGEGSFIGVVRVLDRVCAMAKLEDVTPHTLRHTFASVAAELGFSELTISALLGHAARGVTQGYIHIDEALMMTSDKVPEEIADLLDGRAPAPRRRVRRADLTERPLEVVVAADERR